MKVREQFGRPIGSFQAIKHGWPTCCVEVEAARSARRTPRRALAAAHPTLAVGGLGEVVLLGGGLGRAPAESIQVHGGIGFTWEHDAHLYFKRAKARESLLGSPAWHRARLAAHVLDE